jgi:arylsulfatase A-like enzyme
MKGKNAGPFFLWTHLMVPHSPYLPGKPFKGAFSGNTDEFASFESQKDFLSRRYLPEEQPSIDKIRLRYDENLLYADNALGSFLSRLQKSGRLDDSIVIVSADHGESFSHGWQGHGGPHLYQPFVHIPLLIHLPGQKKGQRIGTTVSQTDIAPTILDLLGYKVPSWMNGRSLKDALQGGQLADVPVFTMNLDGNPVRGRFTKGSAAVFYGNYKFINSGEFFNLQIDPYEQTNLLQQESESALRMNAMINDMLTRHR